MCAICTPGQMCTRVLICSTELHHLERWSKFALGCKLAAGCIFIKHRLHDQNTPEVQKYTRGVYLHWVQIVHINEALVYIDLHSKVLDIVSPVFMSYDLTEHISYMFYRILYHFNSQMLMYILYIVFICIIVYMFCFIEGHWADWLI